MVKTRKRRRGTALVESKKGILVTAGRHKVFLLPGGGTDKGESRRKAAIRELREETGLKAISSRYLLSYTAEPHKAHGGGYFQDHHKVFLIEATGHARPRHEIKHVVWYRPGMDIKLSSATLDIINKYYTMKEDLKEGAIELDSSPIHKILRVVGLGRRRH